jgi:transposase
MKVRFEIDIKESEGELKEMFLAENNGRIKERIYMLYLLKKGICKNIKSLTDYIPHDRNTISGWIKKYKSEGTELLFKIISPPGRKSILSDDIITELRKKLSDSEGFGSYDEICRWVEKKTGNKINIKTLYHICHYKLKAVSKIPRPYNPKQNKENIIDFKEKFSDDIKKRNLKRRNTEK